MHGLQLGSARRLIARGGVEEVERDSSFHGGEKRLERARFCGIWVPSRRLQLAGEI